MRSYTSGYSKGEEWKMKFTRTLKTSGLSFMFYRLTHLLLLSGARNWAHYWAPGFMWLAGIYEMRANARDPSNLVLRSRAAEAISGIPAWGRKLVKMILIILLVGTAGVMFNYT